MLKERLQTGLALIALAALVLYVGGWLLAVAALAVFAAVNFEYHSFAVRLPRGLTIANCCAAGVVPVGYLIGGWRGWALGSAVFLLFLFSELVFIVESRRHQYSLRDLVPPLGLGAAYSGVLASFLVAAAVPPLGSRYVTWLLAVVVLSDSCAYFGGRSLTTPHLAPRISPKKTWGGAICGLIGALIGGVWVYGAVGLGGHWLTAALLSCIAGLLCQIGDLVESLIKRVYNVKDSGALLPGHGGVLDRVDGLLFAAPLLSVISFFSPG